MILLLLAMMIGQGQAKKAAPQPQAQPSHATVTCTTPKPTKPGIRNVDKTGKCPPGEKPLLGPDNKTTISCLGKEIPKPVCTPVPAK